MALIHGKQFKDTTVRLQKIDTASGQILNMAGTTELYLGGTSSILSIGNNSSLVLGTASTITGGNISVNLGDVVSTTGNIDITVNGTFDYTAGGDFTLDLVNNTLSIDNGNTLDVTFGTSSLTLGTTNISTETLDITTTGNVVVNLNDNDITVNDGGTLSVDFATSSLFLGSTNINTGSLDIESTGNVSLDSNGNDLTVLSGTTSVTTTGMTLTSTITDINLGDTTIDTGTLIAVFGDSTITTDALTLVTTDLADLSFGNGLTATVTGSSDLNFNGVVNMDVAEQYNLNVVGTGSVINIADSADIDFGDNTTLDFGLGSYITVGDTSFVSIGNSNNVMLGNNNIITVGNDLLSNIGTSASINFDAGAVISLSTSSYISVPDAPSSEFHLANKQYVDSVAAGLDIKESVKIATTENISLGATSGAVIDGFTLSDGDRVLVKDQSNATENGIYIVSSTQSWQRSPGLNNLSPSGATFSGEVRAGVFTFVSDGAQNKGNGYVIISVGSLGGGIHDLGTDDIIWDLFSGAGTFIWGKGLTNTANLVEVDLYDHSGMTFVSDELSISPSLFTIDSATAFGSGMTYENVDGGKLRFNITPDSGLIHDVSDNAVKISETAAGNGLTFSAGVFNIVSDSNTISATAGGSPTASSSIIVESDLIRTESAVIPMSFSYSNSTLDIVAGVDSVQSAIEKVVESLASLAVSEIKEESFFSQVVATFSVGVISPGAYTWDGLSDGSSFVFLNGISYKVGDGKEFYFSSDGGTTKTSNIVTLNDELYVDTNVLGYPLDAGDEIVVKYSTKTF